MLTNENREVELSVKPVELAELESVEGGVMPMYTADGKMVTCTDPRRWQSPGTLYPRPFWF